MISKYEQQIIDQNKENKSGTALIIQKDQNITNLQFLDMLHDQYKVFCIKCCNSIKFDQTPKYIKELHLYACNLNEIQGIEQMNQLVQLSIAENQIKSIKALQNMCNLTHLILNGNNISDLTPLQQLDNLSYLNLQTNCIEDVYCLRKLVNLGQLFLGFNKIGDIAPLQDMINLIELQLQSNQIIDVSPLQNMYCMFSLELSQNQIVDISAIKHLPFKYLNISDNFIITAINNESKIISHNQKSPTAHQISFSCTLSALYLIQTKLIEIRFMRERISFQKVRLYQNVTKNINDHLTVLNKRNIKLQMFLDQNGCDSQ
ncbi:leucine-rich_repeat domain-containing protein [Hexamita inflata]|uniref:Leucine-rich repeat domain-containing protein n=1 Tax=Hexamita inflata TaxID=28002 RepID=A0AA86R2J3_9EUKA|nr:leucine-rich repeat domain-containing protein [Hexamita inflata]